MDQVGRVRDQDLATGTSRVSSTNPTPLAIYNGRLYIMEEGNERVSVFNLNTK